MSIPIIMKTAVFTLILSAVVVGVLGFLNLLDHLAESLLLVVIFFLVLDVFEREAIRLHKKI
jgi:hypothetical protein